MVSHAEVEVLLFSDRPLPKPKELQDATLYVLPRVPYWQQVALPLALRHHNVQAFHSLAYTLPIASGLPSVVTVHDMGFALAPDTVPNDVRRYLRTMVPQSLKRANKVIVDSHAVMEQLISVYPQHEHKVEVVHLGVEQIFHMEHGGRAECNMEYPYLLAVGSHEPRKNLVRLVAAFASLVQTSAIPHNLVLVGPKGRDTERILETGRALGVSERLQFMDYVPDEQLPALYRAADAFVYPSLFEGFGLPLLEAMASGTPVVTSDRPCMPEVADDAAVYVDPYDVCDIRAGILKALQYRSTLVSAGLKRSQKFSWDRTAEGTVRIYNTIAQK